MQTTRGKFKLNHVTTYSHKVDTLPHHVITQLHHVTSHVVLHVLYSEHPSITRKGYDIPASRFQFTRTYHSPLVIFSFKRCCVKAVTQQVGPGQKKYLAAVLSTRKVLRNANERLYIFCSYTHAMSHTGNKVVGFRWFCHLPDGGTRFLSRFLAQVGVVKNFLPPPWIPYKANFRWGFRVLSFQKIF